MNSLHFMENDGQYHVHTTNAMVRVLC